MNDIHRQFYFGVLVVLQQLVDGNGNLFAIPRTDDKPLFELAYEPRLDEYRHNYLRDSHLAKRDMLMLMHRPINQNAGGWVVLLNVKRHLDQVTIYRDALKYVYGNDYEEALRVLADMLDKFYEVTIEERSGYSRVDFSNGRSPNHGNIYDIGTI